MKCRRGGFTLVEVVVSGALLVLLSLMVAQGFSAYIRLGQRSSRMRKAEELLENQIVREEKAFYTEKVTLEFEDDKTWDVDIVTHKLQSGDVSVSFKVLKDRYYEE